MTETERRPATVERSVDVLVPVVLAVATWFVGVLALGLVARPGAGGVPSVVSLVGGVVLAWPVVTFRPWRPGLGVRARQWADTYRHAVGVAAVLALVSAVGEVVALPAPLPGVLYFSARGSGGLLYGASLFYRSAGGPTAAEAVLVVGQWYVRLLWLFVLGWAVTIPVRRRAEG